MRHGQAVKINQVLYTNLSSRLVSHVCSQLNCQRDSKLTGSSVKQSDRQPASQPDRCNFQNPISVLAFAFLGDLIWGGGLMRHYTSQSVSAVCVCVTVILWHRSCGIAHLLETDLAQSGNIHACVTGARTHTHKQVSPLHVPERRQTPGYRRTQLPL